MSNILGDINEGMTFARLEGSSYDRVKNAFFANYLASLILIKLQDLKGLMLINDPAHSKLTKFSDKMSDLNFWGRSLFYPQDREVKARVQATDRNVEKITDVRIQKLMQVPMSSPENVDWSDTVGSLLLLKHRLGLNSSYFTNIASAVHRWDDLGEVERKRAIQQSLMYLMQSDPQAKIVPRLRALAQSTMLGGIAGAAQKFVGFKKLKEDDGGAATGTASVASTSGATSDNAIVTGGGSSSGDKCSPHQDIQNVLAGLYKLKKKSPLQVTKKGKFIFKDGKVIKKKVKTFKPIKFKAPDYLKVKKEKQGESDA